MSVAPQEECSGRALLRPQSVPHSVSTSAVQSEAPRLSAQCLLSFMKLCNRTMRQQSASGPPFDRQCAVLACSQVLVVCAKRGGVDVHTKQPPCTHRVPRRKADRTGNRTRQ